MPTSTKVGKKELIAIAIASVVAIGFWYATPNSDEPKSPSSQMPTKAPKQTSTSATIGSIDDFRRTIVGTWCFSDLKLYEEKKILASFLRKIVVDASGKHYAAYYRESTDQRWSADEAGSIKYSQPVPNYYEADLGELFQLTNITGAALYGNGSAPDVWEAQYKIGQVSHDCQ